MSVVVAVGVDAMMADVPFDAGHVNGAVHDIAETTVEAAGLSLQIVIQV